MQIDRRDLASIDMEVMRPYVRDSEWFYERPGKEHYRLLAYLSKSISLGRYLVDIGSHLGDSAHALAYNDNHIVHSFDVENRVPWFRRQRTNINYHQANLWEPATRETWKELLLSSALIFVDIDPHEGTRELELVQWLQSQKYQGIIVLDDIWHFKAMRDRLWSQIETRFKTDLTSIGHWSGTGIVQFAGEKVSLKRNSSNDTSNWTLVTGYFDLTNKSDATPEIKARPPEHYLDQHAQGALGLDQNIIVFTDPERVKQIWEIRPKHLHERTEVFGIDFEMLPLTKYRDQIVANRGGTCPSDRRNTASYYLFCMARYALLERAIEKNVFRSTHFAWINICIERMGFRNLACLEEALSWQRLGFSTAFINYLDRRIVLDPTRFFGPNCEGPTTFCSGFFTGGKTDMKTVCRLMQEEFVALVDKGYGHSDEQLMARIYYRQPNLFHWYAGDYSSMITNYSAVREPSSPLRHLVLNSYASGDINVCNAACERIYQSYLDGECELTDDELAMLVAHRDLSRREP